MADAPIPDGALIEASATAVAPPLALYRRYRPDTFAEVIGQEHVTEPLQRALLNNRVNHAYLFSGPRGCGKTTSARILARALNCEQAPVAEPCGQCRSCRDLATGASGSIDVIEIDAASHGGVDDARDLRERAFFSPVSSRYKVYIVDEAHMVTTAGFNALLKLVEEPPPHVKFIFATTEPDKVIGTIRSRTHHYPFRLVPPRVLTDYLARLCTAEGIAVENGVLPLVVRAGAGSVRDSLSVLDQLLGAASERGVSYAQAAALLGYTPDSLLDEMLDAFAAGDAGGVFRCVDKVIEVGQDPRRFAEDLLRRLRDLVIVAAVPDALTSGLVDVADDQADRLSSQAAALGAGEVTRAGEVIAAGLTEMRGTTAPRLHLELMCARVLLPGADLDDRGVHARLDRLERRLGMSGTGAAATGPAGQLPASSGPAAAAPSQPGPSQQTSAQARSSEAAAPSEAPAPSSRQSTASSVDPVTPAGSRPAAPDHSQMSDPTSTAGSAARRAPTAESADLRAVSDDPTPVPDASADDWPTPVTPGRPSAPADPDAPPGGYPQPAQAPLQPGPGQQPPQQAPQGSALSITDLRRLWPEVLDEVKNRRRFTWILLSQNAQLADLTNGTLVLAMPNAGARDSFSRGGSEDVLRESLVTVLGADLQIETMVDPSAAGPGVAGGRDGRPSGPPPGPASGPSAAGGAAGVGDPARSATGEDLDPPPPAPEPEAHRWAAPDAAASASPVRDRPTAQRLGAPTGNRAATSAVPGPTGPVTSAAGPAGTPQDDPPWQVGPPAATDDWETRDAAAARDDETLDEAGESHTELLQRRLGAEIIAEEETGA